MTSSLTNYSSSSEDIYEVENNWEELRKRLNVDESIKAIAEN